MTPPPVGVPAAPRCGKVLRVSRRSFSMLLDGEYACNLPAGHQPADEHTAVVRWTEKKVR